MKKLILITVICPLAFLLSCEKEPIKDMKSQTAATLKVLHTGIQNVYWNNALMQVSLTETVYPHGTNTEAIAGMNRIYSTYTSIQRLTYLPVTTTPPTGQPLEVLEYSILFNPPFQERQFTSSSTIDSAAVNGEITLTPTMKAFELSGVLFNVTNNNVTPVDYRK